MDDVDSQSSAGTRLARNLTTRGSDCESISWIAISCLSRRSQSSTVRSLSVDEVCKGRVSHRHSDIFVIRNELYDSRLTHANASDLQLDDVLIFPDKYAYHSQSQYQGP